MYALAAGILLVALVFAFFYPEATLTTVAEWKDRNRQVRSARILIGFVFLVDLIYFLRAVRQWVS